MTDVPSTPIQPAPPVEPTPPPAEPSRRGVRWVVALLALSLLWYLLADRYTPYTQQARVEAYVVAVAPEVAGRVVRVAVGNNQTVEAGQLLFALDPAPYRIAVERARAELENARRQVGAGTAGIASALGKLSAAEAAERSARQEIERLRRLYRQDPGTVSERRLEVSQANLDKAVSQVAAARAEVQRAREQEGGSGAENAKLRSAAAALAQAERDLANTRIHASSAGLITDLRTEVGLFAGAGRALMTLIASEDLWIRADMTENNLGHLKPGTPARIVLDARPGKVFEGRVRSIGYGVSVSREAPPGGLPAVQNDRDWLREAQRFPVIVEFAPGELPDPRNLRVGGQAEVMAFPTRGNPLNLLGRGFLRVMSWLSYAY